MIKMKKEKIIFSKQEFESDKISAVVVGDYIKEMNMMPLEDFFKFLETAECQCRNTKWRMIRREPKQDEVGVYEQLITMCRNCRSTLAGIIMDQKSIFFMSER